VTPANTGQHIPQRIERFPDSTAYRGEILLINVRVEHLALSSRVFAVGLYVNGKILIMLRIGNAVVFL